MYDYQWQIAADVWRETDRLARDHDVKVALELQPQNIVFNSASIHQPVELSGATNFGVERDASHLFWQQIDPVQVVRRHLGELVVRGVVAALDEAFSTPARAATARRPTAWSGADMATPPVIGELSHGCDRVVPGRRQSA
jgi:sugar phosphate isomerase/epimerase